MASPQELIEALERNAEAYARFVEGQSERAFHYRPAPEEWTAAELTGHVAEFPETFSAQARRLAESPGAAIGRGLDDPGRLAAVARLAGAGPAEAAAAVRRTAEQAAAILRALPAEGWQATGQHPRYGQVTVTEVVERFVVNHLRDHLEQARKTVEAAGTSG